MENTPEVSVITPFYNSEKFLNETILSVINQTYTNWELLLIDDASTDQSPAIAKSFTDSDTRIKLFSHSENFGAGIARNTGIENASGKYIAFLDADDSWLPRKLEKQLAFMQKNNLNLCYSSYLLMDEAGNKTGKMIEALPKLTYQKLLKANYIGNLTGIYNAENLGKIYAAKIRKRQDWALWLKILKTEKETLSIQEPLAVYRVRKNSISQNKWRLLYYNFLVYHKVLGYNKFLSSLKMLIFLWEQFFVKTKQIKSVADQSSKLL